MSKISGGVRIGGFVSPSDSLDTYPTHKSEYGFGGHREVIDLTSRDAITNDRRSEGMTVWVISENKEYRLIGGIANSNWQEVTTGSGSSDPVEWADINNKPNKFTPDTHTHVSTEITDLDVTKFVRNDTDGNINGSLTINTNLTVGSALNINGSILKLNSNVTGTPSQNMQITCERGTLYDSFILWNELDDKWYINDNTGIPREILHTGNITNLPSNSHNHNDLYYTKAETDLKDLFELNADGDIMPRA